LVKLLTVTGTLTVVAPQSIDTFSAVTISAFGLGGGGFTVTVKVQLAVLLALSLTVLVTVVVPNGKELPDAGLLLATGAGESQLSVTVGGGNVTTAEL
jgi:hypothetical protein